ncbi:MAG: ferrochelatase [Bacteroidetes bacterium]|nr:ferrochelatase [Bacteroidota bacterium]
MESNKPSYGIILLNMGGPDSPLAVEPFLYNLFSDRDIFPFPFSNITQKIFAKIVSRFRAGSSSRHYNLIGGASPLNKITRQQAEKLETSLKNIFPCKVFTGMRYCPPFIEDAVNEAVNNGIGNLIFFSMYPQYSLATTGSSLNEVKRVMAKKKYSGIHYLIVRNFYNDPGYIGALAAEIEKALLLFTAEEKSSMGIIFSAHGLPEKFISNGDPYLDEIKTTMDLTLDLIKKNSSAPAFCQNVATALSFQSKVGPVKWLKPSTIDTVKKFPGTGINNLLIVPVSFVADNIETLYELKIELRDIAVQNGVKKFIVADALNDSGLFISAMKDIILKEVKM